MKETIRQIRFGLWQGYQTRFTTYNGKDYNYTLIKENILKCIKCSNASEIIHPCPNCDQSEFLEIDYRKNRTVLICLNCEKIHPQTNWICQKCNCQNPIGNSAFHWVEITTPHKEGCFIATACYGNYDSDEVIVLRKYRDEKLLHNFFGRLFIKFYYVVSPIIVKFIMNSDRIKKILKYLLIQPIVNQLRR